MNLLNKSFTEGVTASHPKHRRWSLHLSAGQCTGSSCSARHTVELLCREFIAADMWPLNSPDIRPVDYCIWELCTNESTTRQYRTWQICARKW